MPEVLKPRRSCMIGRRKSTIRALARWARTSSAKEMQRIPPVSYTHLDVYKRQVLTLVAGAPMAWFTDTEKVNADFKAGILDISVSDDDAFDGTELNFENMRPMTEVTAIAEMKATLNGTQDLSLIHISWRCCMCRGISG